MGFLTILSIAVGLAMDAFAVSIATGIKLGCVTGRQTFRLSFHFGFFQFMMPVLGWFSSILIEEKLQAIDHWIVMGLLSFIGWKMICEAARKDETLTFTYDPTRGFSLVSLSIATSIDAFAVGISFGLLQGGILYPSVVIGLVAAAFTILGLHLGCKIGMLISKKIEILGGIILIAIGVKILLEHTMLAG